MGCIAGGAFRGDGVHCRGAVQAGEGGAVQGCSAGVQRRGSCSAGRAGRAGPGGGAVRGAEGGGGARGFLGPRGEMAWRIVAGAGGDGPRGVLGEGLPRGHQLKQRAVRSRSPRSKCRFTNQEDAMPGDGPWPVNCSPPKQAVAQVLAQWLFHL